MNITTYPASTTDSDSANEIHEYNHPLYSAPHDLRAAINALATHYEQDPSDGRRIIKAIMALLEKP